MEANEKIKELESYIENLNKVLKDKNAEINSIIDHYENLLKEKDNNNYELFKKSALAKNIERFIKEYLDEHYEH